MVAVVAAAAGGRALGVGGLGGGVSEDLGSWLALLPSALRAWTDRMGQRRESGEIVVVAVAPERRDPVVDVAFMASVVDGRWTVREHVRGSGHQSVLYEGSDRSEAIRIWRERAATCLRKTALAQPGATVARDGWADEEWETVRRRWERTSEVTVREAWA